MSDSEEDYMSNEILSQCTVVEGTTSLLRTHKLRREHELHKKKVENQKQNRPLAEIEEERRQEGLSTAIDSENKGYKMLVKMGWQEEKKGLGKTGEGMSQPIDVKLKDNHFGLGTEKEEKNRLNYMQKMQDESAGLFRASLLQKKEARMLKYDFAKVQRTCMNLDRKLGAKPPQKWYWPPKMKPVISKFNSQAKSDLESDSDSSDTSSENCLSDEEDSIDEMAIKFTQINKYLRETYNYCLYCGVEYADYKDLSKLCPGPTRLLHEENDVVLHDSDTN